MFRKTMIAFTLGNTLLFAMSADAVQRASKDELGCIKGLGVKRIESIIAYRKEHKIDTLEELLNIRGIGKIILNNIKTDTQKKVCTSFSEPKNNNNKNRKKDINAE